jgi:hypothetical protein
MQSVERFRKSRVAEDERVGRNDTVDEYNLQDSDDQAPYRHNIQVENCLDEDVISTIHVEKHEQHFCSELGLAVDQWHLLHLRCLPSPLSRKERCSSLQEARGSDDPISWKPFQIQGPSTNLYQHVLLSKGGFIRNKLCRNFRHPDVAEPEDWGRSR